MANISKQKRDKMIGFLEYLKSQHSDDESLKALNEIESALLEKKYGLVWEQHTEHVDEMMKDHIPVFVEDKEREIISDPALPYNFLLEGDNLHSLKLLEKTHRGKIDIIYIDPPYNTGKKDFKYNDDYYLKQDDGYIHSKWLSFMERRLKIAKKILSQRGVIFISIDDNEYANLKLVCDEVFGERNFIATIIWEKAYSPVNLKKHFSENHDYILAYANNKEFSKNNGLKRTTVANSRYKNPDNDVRGPWKAADSTVGPAVPEKVYDLTLPSGRVVKPSSGRCWLYSKEKFNELIADNRVWFGSDGNSVPAIKKFLSEVKQTTTPMTIWKYTEVGHSQSAAQQLKMMFSGESKFTYPKPVTLIKRILELYSLKDSIILDFFAGSGTTAQAVLELNKEDGGNRQYILCTNNENNICEEVTYQRCKIVITGKKLDGTLYAEGIPSNLKYYKTDFVERYPQQDSLSDLLLEHIQEMVQLENGINIDTTHIMILDEEDADAVLTDSIANDSQIYLASDVLLSNEQKELILHKNITVNNIPDYYFNFELKEVGE